MIEQLKTIREALEIANLGLEDSVATQQALAALAQLEAMVGSQEPAAWIPPQDGRWHWSDSVQAYRTEKAGWEPVFSAPVAQQYEAGDVASAAAQGFRDGVASVTQQEPVAWMANFTNRYGNADVYVTTHKHLAVENDANGTPRPLVFGDAAPVAQQQEPMFWVRLCSDGMYEGPIHNKQIERVRAQSGAWSPLFLGAAPVAQQPQNWQPITEHDLAQVESWLMTPASAMLPADQTHLMNLTAHMIREVRATRAAQQPQAECAMCGGMGYIDGIGNRCGLCDGAGRQPQAEAVPTNCDVRKIMLAVVPGPDGMGHEVYAKSVDDVVNLLTKMGERIEDLEGAKQAEAVRPDPRPVIEMCAKALAEELAAWDIDPPLHHVKEASDACEAWLASIAQQKGQP